MDVNHPVLEDPTVPTGHDADGTGNDSATSGSPTTTTASAGDAPIKKKVPPTVAKVPWKKAPPKSASTKSSMSSSHRSSSSSLRNSNSTLGQQQRQLPQLDPPVLTIALFHAAQEPQKYNPSKQQRGDSNDVFLGMTCMDVTTLLTGKDRCFDDWWCLQGGPDGSSANNSSSVRVVVEYEPSDTAPRTGDRVKFTRYCHAADLYPCSPFGTYEVQSVQGDNVTIGGTSPEGWCTSAIVRRHALVCQERQVSVTERILPHWATLGERLGQSPLVQTLQSGVSRVPDDGLVSVAQDVLTNSQGLLARWWQGGLGTALEDVRHATNWDGQTLPTAEESLELPMPPSIEEEEAAVIPVEDDDDDDDDVSQDADRSFLPNMPVCPISQEPMKDPVVAADGHTYERSAIARWLATSDKSPLTGGVLAHKELVPNYMLLSSLREAAAVASAPTPTSSNNNNTNTNVLSANDNAMELALDDNSNDPPSLIDEDEGDLREEHLE